MEHIVSNFNENREFNEIPDWVQGPLIVGIKELSLSLRYIEFMGHEAVLEKLANVYNRTLQSETIMKSEGYNNKSIKKIRDILITIVLIGDLFVLPVNMLDSGKRYYGSLAYVISYFHEKSQRLLPKPDAEDFKIGST